MDEWLATLYQRKKGGAGMQITALKDTRTDERIGFIQNRELVFLRLIRAVCLSLFFFSAAFFMACGEASEEFGGFSKSYLWR